MAALNDLNIVTQAFLDAAVEALALTDAGAPGHAYIAPGEPALDCCGQLTVYLGSISRADLNAGPGALAGMKAINRGGQPILTINVQATRCQIGLNKYLNALENGDIPDPADMQATAHMVDQDGWALHCGFMNSLRHGELAQVCEGAEMVGGQKLTPQGGCVGWTFQFRYPIQGGILA